MLARHRQSLILQAVWNEGAQGGFTAALVEKDFVAGEDVAGLECGGVFGGGFDLGNEAVCGGEADAGALVAHRGRSAGICRTCIGFRIPSIPCMMRWKTGAELGEFTGPSYVQSRF